MTSRVLPPDVGLDEAAAILRAGGLVAFPTETVYGLGANALDARAAARIFEAKQRPRFDPLIVHLADADEVGSVATEVGAPARRLMEAFWPGPLTLVLPKSADLPSIVTSGLDTVAVRVPDHPVAKALLERTRLPIAAPSANPFGRLSPTRAQHVVDSLGDAVDLVIDGGPTQWGVESTIVDVTTTPRVLRFGATTVEAIEEVLGAKLERPQLKGVPQVPGQLPQHYAPQTKLVLVDRGASLDDVPPNAAYLAFAAAPEGRWGHVELLSPSGDLREASARVFEVLHQLDAAAFSCIVAERVPDHGLGRAINDRLARAAATWA